MNIELQCCGLFIMIIIFIMFCHEKKLDLVNRKLFFRASLACIACLILDIVSIILVSSVYGQVNLLPIAQSDTWLFISKMTCKLYIMMLVMQGYFGYVYVATSMFPRIPMWSKVARCIYHMIFFIGELLIAAMPIYCSVEGRKMYTYGLAANTAYVLCAIYVLSTIAITVVYKQKISIRRYLAIMLWQAVWLIAATIQFMFPDILLISFASAFGMVILYVQLENPSEYIDNATGAFTLNALSSFVHDKYKFGESFAMFTAKINFVNSYVDFNIEHDAITRTVKALTGLGDEPVFRLDDNTFCVIYDYPEKMREMAAKIKKMKDGVTDISAKGTYLLLDDSFKLSGPDEFFKALHMYLNTDQEITELDDKHIEDLRAENKIYDFVAKALSDDRVEVYYQPFYNVTEKKFTAAEALVRIIDEDGSIIPPGKFIGITEKNGQIIPLGMRIFEKVCQFLATGQAQSLGLEYIEVNISAAQFDHENPAKFVLHYMNKYRINPKNINLEITETAAMDNRNATLRNIDKLIEHGITFSLDDFGTGRSNLDYFINMPVRNIKFDYSFTQSYFNNDKTKTVLSGMADMMHKMDMHVISEGIETEEQMEAMQDMGIEYIQGFYFSRPIPEDQFIEFLKQNNHMKQLQ